MHTRYSVQCLVHTNDSKHLLIEWAKGRKKTKQNKKTVYLKILPALLSPTSQGVEEFKRASIQHPELPQQIRYLNINFGMYANLAPPLQSC